jgi:hypothetical protein
MVNLPRQLESGKQVAKKIALFEQVLIDPGVSWLQREGMIPLLAITVN